MWWFPTVLAVGLVLVFRVGECQHWIGPAGQAGTPLWWLSKISMAPKPPAVFRWCRSLSVIIQVPDHTNGEAAVGPAQVRAEGQAVLRRWLVDPKVTHTEVLTWNKTAFLAEVWPSLCLQTYLITHILYFSILILFCMFSVSLRHRWLILWTFKKLLTIYRENRIPTHSEGHTQFVDSEYLCLMLWQFSIK